MNRNRDFDETLKDWLEDGADHAPERYIWSALEDVERTAQRGAWLASLEEFLMTIKLPALVLGTATVIIITALATYQLVGPSPGAPGASPSPSSSSQPAADAFSADDLPNIVLTAANAPEGLTVDATETGETAFVVPLPDDSHPGGPFMDQVGFVDALMTNLNSTETGGYVSWSALFETAAGAEVAFDFLVEEHGSAGWGMARSSFYPAFGDENWSFTGAAYNLFPTNLTYLWRVDNLVLAAVGVGDYDPAMVWSIMDLMASRHQ